MHEVRALVWAGLVMGVCGAAVLRGGSYERLAAGGLLAGWAVSMVVSRTGFRETEWGIMAVDLALLALLVWIALRSPRYWPLFAAGFHLLAIVTHLLDGIDPTVSGWAYVTAEIFWGYLLAVTIGYGAWTTRRMSDAPQ